jgi:signal transduction histidine kinase
MINPKKRFPHWAVLTIFILISTITEISILSIKRWADISYDSKLLLTKVAKNINNLNALEWQGIANKKVDFELNEQINKTQTDIDLLLNKLTENEINKQITKQLFILYQEYNKALEQQLSLIAANKIQQAIKIDKELVDPTFAKLNNQINSLSIFYELQKQKADQISNLGITITFLLTAVIFGEFFWRYNSFLLAKNEELKKILDELQQTQSQLIQTEKMAGLGQMVAGIAHEINNPVSFIDGNIQYVKNYAQDLLGLVLLYQQHYPESTPEIQDCINKIDLEFISEDLNKILLSMTNGTERISNIVLSLRNFSRLGETDIKDVDLHEGIESTLLIINYKFLNKIEIIRKYSDLPLVSCFPGILNQVFMNILSNACDALLSQESLVNKQIVIQTEQLVENQVSIKIRDNGVGMPPEIQAKIFDPFFTTKPVGKGTGIGLSICYKIIEKHNGKITVTSEVAKGTEFIIFIPIKYKLQD